MKYKITRLEREHLKIKRIKYLLNLVKYELKLKVRFLYLDEHMNVTHVLFIDHEGNTLSEGSGKGFESIVGAIAECLEHYALIYASPSLILCNLQKIYEQKFVYYDGLIQSLQFTEGDKINCVEFNSIGKSGDTILIPAVLVSYGYLNINQIKLESEKYLIKYYTNSGTAFGCTVNEAIIHGINEIIERDSLSNLYNKIIRDEELNIFKVSDKILADIFYDNEEIRSFLSSIIVYFDGENTLIPFSFAILKDSNHPITLIGSGCSIFSHAAIYRAVTELYQICILYDDKMLKEDEKNRAFLEENPRLTKLIDLTKLNVYKMITQLPSKNRMKLSQQINYLENKLSKIGKQVYTNTIRKFQYGFVVVQVYIPGMDRFELVRNGMKVVPQHLFLEKN